MELHADLEAPCSAQELFTWVDDLARYPTWLTIVTRAEAYATDPPAWSVDLTGRIGPFARSKRLRMARTTYEPDHLVVFERQEADGRQHAAWLLTAEVTPIDGTPVDGTPVDGTPVDQTPTGRGSRLAMVLRYDGSFWGPVLERLLSDEVARGRERLLGLVSGPTR